MHIQFTASQSVEILIPEGEHSVEAYLAKPSRLVRALTEADRVTFLGNDCFQLRMRALSFMTLHIQPVVELRVWLEQPGDVRLQAVSCVLEGLGKLNDHFGLEFEGYLLTVRSAQRHGSGRANPVRATLGASIPIVLQGLADLRVQIDLPPPFSLTPRVLLETTGNALIKSLLLSMQQRLKRQLVADYMAWARMSQESVTLKSGPLAG